jgi:succinoglycan biosynthesis transport protein ExoP
MSWNGQLIPVPTPAPTDVDSRFVSPASAATNKMDIAELWRMLSRRRWLILATIVVLTATGITTTSLLTPRFTAEALLMVGDQQRHMLDLQSVVTGSDTELTDSEIQIVKSRRIARLVVEKLNMLKDPAFGAVVKPKGWLSDIQRYGSDTLANIEKALWAPAARPENFENPEGDANMSRAIDYLINHLSVVAKGRSRVIAISFETENPKTAASVTNTIADTYIQDDLGSKLQGTIQANQWLSERVSELRTQVVGIDKVVQQRKSDAGITAGKQVELINEQISSLSEQLILAGADRAQADAKLQEARRASQSGGAVSDIAASPVIQKLRGDQSDIKSQLAQANEVMGDKNPTVQRLHAELSANSAALGGEAQKIISGLANSASIAQAREKSLSIALDALKKEAGRTEAADVDINAQQREAEANHNLYDRLLSRSKETSIESGLQQPDAHVISHADVPLRPSFPNKPLVIALSFIGAALIASLLVIGLESIDQGFRDLAHVEQTLGVSALGFVPRLKAGEHPETQVLSKPFSAYAEAIRGVYTSLILSDVDRPPKIVLITSSLPGEGKSATSVALARLVARSGKKVLVIDSDLRKPRIHEEFGVPIKPGLIDYLAGKAPISEVLLKDTQSEAFVLPPGTHAPNPTDVFSSDNMQKLLRTLSSSFDLIILDSAPLLAVSDTRNLCRLADKVLFVLRWQHTRKAAAIPAIRQILNAGGNMAGVLLTQTDMARLPNYTGSMYYQRQIQKYYTSTGA